MISGTIRLHEEPVNSYQSNFRRGQDTYNDMYGSIYRTNTPLYKDQAPIIEEALKIGQELGFVLGARVKRKSGNGNVGTITHVHSSFSQAWNYSSGELEPFKVTWDGVNGTMNGTFDYGMQDLVLEDEKQQPLIFLALQQQLKEEQDETLLNLC